METKIHHEPPGVEELREMRSNILRSINSLELCWRCQRICECDQWLVNEVALVWICRECRPKISYRLEKPPKFRVSYSD